MARTGCSSCSKRKGLKYEATFPEGHEPATQRYDTVQEAQNALTSAGGGTFRAVAAG